jgi:AcrR family transcriptional regulator
VTVALKKPHKSARKPKGDGHLRRGEILAAAERIFIAEGYSGATIRKIADAVGVSSTALYMHFRDKDQILLEISNDAIGQLWRELDIAHRPIDAVARVQADARGVHEVRPRQSQHLPAGVLRHARRDLQGEAGRHRRTGRSLLREFSGPIHEIAAAGPPALGLGESAAQVLWAACHGLVALLITMPSATGRRARS